MTGNAEKGMLEGRGPVAGAVLVDKPEGPTSHDVVRIARRTFGTRRVGHTGTLDPFASGLLVLCVGWATRLSEYLTGLDKVYRGVLRLGQVTDTADRTGEVIRRSEGWRDLEVGEIEAAFRTQLGEIDQVPPAYSAKKVGGVRSYDRARRGELVELEPARVRIERIEILEVELPTVAFEVECSSGTYIRSLARDVGEALGVGAHLEALRRIRVGGFDLAGAVPVDRLGDAGAVAEGWLTPLEAVAHLHRVDLGEIEVGAVRNGVRVTAPPTAPVGVPIALAHEGRLVAIGRVEDGLIHAGKVFPVD